MDFRKVAAQLGIDLRIVSTGHVDFKRGFLTYKGIYLGRITILKNEYDHVKWFAGGGTGPLNEYDHVILSWERAERDLPILTDAEWEWVKYKAEEEEALDFQLKTAWRKAHPRKGRKGLKHKNLRCFLEFYPFELRH